METQNTAKSQAPSNAMARAGHRLFPWRLLVGLGAVILAAFLVEPRRPSPAWLIGSLALVGLGLALRAWAAAFAGGHTRDASISAPRLITSGPYGRVRNPIYLGTIILGCGMVGLIGDLRLIPLLFAACLLLYATIIPAEEQFLARKFGEEFSRYRRAVPCLIPRLTSWTAGSPAQPIWSNARGELSIAAILLAIQAFLRFSAWLRN
jgi:protein-S-isoprenylcysteine O-methyltransferase Ste14